MELSEVSKTAINTLRCHALESPKHQPILRDPMAQYCLEQLAARVSEDERQQLFRRRLNPALMNYIVLRARKYDIIANQYVAETPSATVVNLGCGFDTRYWRIHHENCRYVELDLPEMVDLKKHILGEQLCYELIGCSVLDSSWIDQVTSGGSSNFLLMAEGLFMYLPKEPVKGLIHEFSKRFVRSRMVLEVVAEPYTRGIWKQLITMKMKQETGSDAGASYSFGIRNAAELETYGKGIRVIDEWAYVDEPEMHPNLYKYLGISRVQWTVTVALN